MKNQGKTANLEAVDKTRGKRKWSLLRNPRSIKKFSLSKKQPPEVFCKKDVIRNFAKFTGKHLCHSLFLNKVAGKGLQFY